MSTVQAVIWFDQMLQPDWPCYQIGLCGDIHGPLDVALLHHALRQSTRLHDGLRLAPATAITEALAIGAMPGLVLLDEADPAWQFVDLSEALGAEATPEALRQAALDRVQKHFESPMALQAGVPPWDMLVVRYGPDRHLWLHRYHHLVLDGYGLPLAGIATVDIYNRLVEGEPADLSPPPSYLDYVAAEQAYAASPRHAADRAFWQQRFAQLPPALLPARWVAASGERAGSGKQVWALARPTMARIHAL
ncbi:MAG: hypothetical protein RI920_1754, partial [Pseudomonadota bacterium]